MGAKGIEIQQFDRVIESGKDVEFTADLSQNVVRVCRGLTPEQYVRIGLTLGRETLMDSRQVEFVGDVD